MFFNTIFTTILLATASIAAPINGPQELIVFNPPIISPKSSEAWPMGSQQTVRWNTTNIPAERQNTTGLILLGYLENDSEHLDIDNPLASGFPINRGSVNVTMPIGIQPRDDYIVVLFGDSGNKSPKFRIH